MVPASSAGFEYSDVKGWSKRSAFLHSIGDRQFELWLSGQEVVILVSRPFPGRSVSIDVERAAGRQQIWSADEGLHRVDRDEYAALFE
jgi:hypothetical protein